MATWTIISGTGTGTQLVGCKIVKTVRNGVVTYQFVGKGVNEGNPTINTTAPNLTNVPYNQNTWNISSATPPPTWSGSCQNSTSSTGDPGTWTAQSGGGGDDDDDLVKKRKSKKSAKATSKKSVKGTSKKSASSTKSMKGTKGSKRAKSAKSTKSTKRTRGRG